MVTGSLSVLLGMLWLTRATLDTQLPQWSRRPAAAVRPGRRDDLHPADRSRISPASQPEDAGAASGMLNVLQQVGGALGLGILVTIFGTASRNSTASAANPVEHAREVLTDGVHAAFIGSAIYAALTLTVIVLGVRPWAKRPAPATAPVVESEIPVESIG